MLFITVVLNYIDRANLAIAAPAMRTDLHLDSKQMGLLMSSFGLSYALCQIPGGWLVDRVHPRVLLTVLLAAWSCGTILTGFASTLTMVFALRLVIGILESPAYPMNARIATTWFPERERGRAVAFYISGQFVGLAFLTPVLSWLQSRYSWHAIFWCTGSLGILWAGVWHAFYRDPLDSPRTNAAEVAHIRDGGGMPEGSARKKATPIVVDDLVALLNKRQLWGVYIGQFAVTSTLWFFLTWFPTYLVEARGMSFVKAGILASIPPLAAFAGVLTAGAFSDYLLRCGVNVAVARKIPIVTGLCLSATVVTANFVEVPALVITCMAIAFFGTGLSSITWSLVADIAPKRLVGLTSGVFNLLGNLAAVVTPFVVGHLVQGTDFSDALIYIASVAAMGALSYILVVGKVERLQDPAEIA
ncbi:MAG: MFS transporter [Clostridia bacterium]|nr:MFS transporter [Deltaproteobacteria bacterium]